MAKVPLWLFSLLRSSNIILRLLLFNKGSWAPKYDQAAICDASHWYIRFSYRSCPLFVQGRQLYLQTINGISYDRMHVNTVKIHLNYVFAFTFLYLLDVVLQKTVRASTCENTQPHTDCYNHLTLLLLLLQKSCKWRINHPLTCGELYQLLACWCMAMDSRTNGTNVNDSYCIRVLWIDISSPDKCLCIFITVVNFSQCSCQFEVEFGIGPITASSILIPLF